MYQSYLLLFLLFLNSSTLTAQTTQYTLLKNAHIINGMSPTPQKGDILIKGKYIEKIDYQQPIIPPKGTITYDLTDKFIIPGLIDAHVHLATDPSGADKLSEAKKRLVCLLKNGVTSVRDMAGDTRLLAFLARAAALNEIDAPNIYYVALMAGRSFFDDPRTHSSARGVVAGDCPWMKAVDMKTNMALAIAEAKGTGASAIKVYANLEAPVIEKIVTIAHAQGLKVWSHATVFPAQAQEVVATNVDAVSHATLLAWAGVKGIPNSAKGRYVKQANFDIKNPAFTTLMQTMKEKGTMLDATLATYRHERFDTSIFQQGLALTRMAYEHGVPIGVGTDMDWAVSSTTTPLVQEMTILVEQVGMSPMEVLQAATWTNAKMIGIAAKTGSIEIGKWADLVVLERDPLANISNVGEVRYVFKLGKVIP